ncbi:AAC(3) family N-acetyltransferase [Pelagibacteraceae bacterium]|nr:AAC(3) family N-acetyltransferase [Pelagibacteraceae bacterium]
MKLYNTNDIHKALKKIGISKNDTVYICPEIYKLGKLDGAKSKSEYIEVFFKIISEIIGPGGTLVINTYTFQTLRQNKIFKYEKTPSSSGAFSEYVRNKKNSLRSLHPVFSVCAIGKQKHSICSNNSTSNYGEGSPYQNFLDLGGKILNLGMDPWLNPFLHLAEMKAGISYKYSKLNELTYIKNKKKIKKIFSSYVRYLGLTIEFDYSNFSKEINKRKLVKSANLGNGKVYSINASKYVSLLTKLLSKDQFYLLRKIPNVNRLKKIQKNI